MRQNTRDGVVVEQALSELKFLTVTEVASHLRVSKMTVYRLVHDGELKAVRVGKSFRILESEVSAYLRSASEVKPQ